MKVPAALLLLLAGLLSAVPAVQAQEAAAPLLDDPAGDAQLLVGDAPATSANAVYPSVDLVALSVAEVPEAFIWTIEAGDLRAGNEETGADGFRYEVYFTHNGRHFMMMAAISLQAIDGQPLAYLNSRDSPDGQWTGVWFSAEAAVADLAADTVTVTLPRELLADLDGATPFPGRSLEAVHVEARSTFSGSSINVLERIPTPYDVQDHMPNAADAWATYAVQVGVQQLGDARLSSLQPFRASNGEATTFVYQVEASNIGDENATYQLVVAGATKADVVLPFDVLTIASGETVSVPVLATIPFAHDHGGVDRFLLELRDVDDPANVGRLEMGIRYLTVPQPAGHHDTVFLHLPRPSGAAPTSVLTFQEGFMNTLEEDERAGTQPWHATGFSGSGASFSSYWDFTLSPGLEMGLDIATETLGQALVPVRATTPLVGAVLRGELYVGNAAGRFGFSDQEWLIGTFASAPVDIQANQAHTFQLELRPTADVETVPFAPGQNLFLSMELEYTLTPPLAIGLASETPAIDPGGFLRLPLNEYHDDVDEALALLDGPRLGLDGPQQRLVNPGEAVVFNVLLENPSNDSVPMRIGLTGLNAAWAAVDDASFTLPAESATNVTVVVRAPTGALDGERADLILQAYPRDEPMSRGLLRLVVDVDTEADHADDAPLAEDIGKPAKDTPAMAPGLGLLALAALALARRKAP